MTTHTTFTHPQRHLITSRDLRFAAEGPRGLQHELNSMPWPLSDIYLLFFTSMKQASVEPCVQALLISITAGASVATHWQIS